VSVCRRSFVGDAGVGVQVEGPSSVLCSMRRAMASGPASVSRVSPMSSSLRLQTGARARVCVCVPAHTRVCARATTGMV
jgi:hypothetical protein